MSRLLQVVYFVFSLTVVSGQNYGDLGGSNSPQVKIVNAMCTASGITASIAFDRPFSGIIYSMGYGNVHECVYYNAILTENILFSIPNDRCGTHVTQNIHELVETIENRVYVQMDKLTQTVADKQYAFVCQQPYSPNTITNRIGNEIRRHPLSLSKPIIPIVDNRPANGWNLPNSPFYAPNQPPGLYPFQASRNSPSDTFYIHTTLPTTKRLYSSEEKENSLADAKSELLSKAATTRAYGNRSSWSIVNTNTPEVIDDFNPVSSSQATTNSDADLLVVSGEERMKTTPSGTSTTMIRDHESTSNPVIAPKSANSIDTSAMEPETKLYANQHFEKLTESVQLEIQKGEGPFNHSINSAVKIGDMITLTVKGKAASKDQQQFNMFVHSCYATDDNNTVRVNLIDSSGCSIHSQVLRPMQRLRVNDDIIYFFPLKAFKFPGPSEVFFYCSIDISPDYNFPELCTKMPVRTARSASKDQYFELSLSKNVTIQMPSSALAEKIEGVPEEPQSNSTFLLTSSFLGVSALFLALSLIAYFRYKK
ncbi:ZP domain-containing protein [Aphelenchoides besseyi]|nr:ZP domain-containing protein [Aphelenchoides besseyi]KAI6201376.1 ZP domain-containing protein [Aphelenchoides besseyi]